MRICVLSWSFYDWDRRVRRGAESLIEKGYMVDAICLKIKGQKKKDVICGVNVYRIQERERNEEKKIDYIKQLIKFFVLSCFYVTKFQIRKRYDIIHVHSVPDFEVFAAFLPKLMGAKIILDIHDPVPDFYAEKFKNGRKNIAVNLLKLIEYLSSKFSDHVITVTDYWKSKIARRSFIPDKKISVLENFPDHKFFNSKNFTRNEKSSENFTLLYTGALQKHYAFDTVIKAVDFLKEEIPSIMFLIYGIGKERSELLSLIKELGLENFVFLKSVVPINEVPKLINRANIGIALLSADSNYAQQALSVKIFEFLAMGLPVITTRTKALEYYLNDSIVMFAEANDPSHVAKCIRELYFNPNQKRKLIMNGLNYIKKNNWELKKNDFYHLINKLTLPLF